MVKLDRKGSFDYGFGQGAFLVGPLGGLFGFDPPTCPSTLRWGCLLLCIIRLTWHCCAVLGSPVGTVVLCAVSGLACGVPTHCVDQLGGG